MNKQLFKDTVGWGVGLWFIGYILGIGLFMIVPPTLLGWVIMPIGMAITLWVLLKKVTANTFGYYVGLGVIWSIVAIILDYFLLVKVFKPADGYYKLDVYLYYLLTFMMPITVGFMRTKKK